MHSWGGKNGINRNIVECKVGSQLIGLRMRPVLIETLWNVKYSLINGKSVSCGVLIETLWNVKAYYWTGRAYITDVLIETLWNVKKRVNCFSFWILLY